ncbi:hypothetical protein [Candidatus Williamhamiltonella defendens]|uniref:hypothetical protein n=1 Tax=Candidatus Williamhamiltonella defendens TaxID=138072 RepID=UPI001652045D|nr:hypothetical protein [Candidatus Hamiltonella defensa]
MDASVEYPALPGKPLDPKAGEADWPKAPRGQDEGTCTQIWVQALENHHTPVVFS